MCGIWAYLTEKDDIDFDTIFSNFKNIAGRGPDNMTFLSVKNKYMLGFTRLSIMDPSPKGNQPFEYYQDDIKYTCICNGEIYNAEELKGLVEYNFTSTSDCEVLIPLYLKYNVEMISKLDGVFSFIIIKETTEETEYFIVRDRIGIRPLYVGIDDFGQYIFASELKAMKNIAVNAEQFCPGTYCLIKRNHVNKETKEEKNTYYDVTSKLELKWLKTYQQDEDKIMEFIRNKLTAAVKKRLISDRPVCALLSGGLDSSLVCSIASKLLKEKGIPLYTFSIGIPGSPDNVYAQKVADYIGSIHRVVNITSEDALNALKDVIWATETFDITTVRASTGQYLVSKYIAENTNFKVVLSGDGSDEVTSGYLENFLAPNLEDLHSHAIDRIKNIHYYDVLRADRATSIHGLELRVPFLDVSFVDFYLQIDPKLRQPIKGKQCEKYLLRKAFEIDYLPNEVLWRQKEAFSDGISSEDNSWHSIIQKMCDKLITDNELDDNNKFTFCKPLTKEAYYYRQVFTDLYGNKFGNIIPAFWMPKWSNTTDPSARSLKVYNAEQDQDKEQTL